MPTLKIKTDIAISDTGFVFIPSTGDSFSVNPMGAELINLIKQGKPVDDIRKKILTSYNIDPATFEKDYYDFVRQLKQYNLLTEK